MILPKKLWEKYVYREILQTVVLCLVCFFLLFAIIDYSVHMRGFLRIAHLPILKIITYYCLQFIKHLDVLLPVSLLVTTVKILRNMTEKHELLALQVAGLSLKNILAPFMVIASLAVLISFTTEEFILPTSVQKANHFQSTYLKKSSSEKSGRLRVLELKDGSRLAFQKFDAQTQTFHDVFWIRSMDDLWRIKTLKLDRDYPEAPPLCQYVDIIARGKDGGLHKINSFEHICPKELKPRTYCGEKQDSPFESCSISRLFKELKTSKTTQNRNLGELSAEFFMKCTKPFVSLLATLLIAPFCVRFSRLSSAIPFYALGIFGIIAYFVAIQAGGILTMNQIFSPWAVIVCPCVFLFSYAILRLIKI